MTTKISELINNLQAIKNKHGDMGVRFFDIKAKKLFFIDAEVKAWPLNGTNPLNRKQDYICEISI
jgi:hypothetical protein